MMDHIVEQNIISLLLCDVCISNYTERFCSPFLGFIRSPVHHISERCLGQVGVADPAAPAVAQTAMQAPTVQAKRQEAQQ